MAADLFYKTPDELDEDAQIEQDVEDAFKFAEELLGESHSVPTGLQQDPPRTPTGPEAPGTYDEFLEMWTEQDENLFNALYGQDE